ncbi:MAG: hypothetical protein KDK45_16990, partial [Leptospiraceae bacterium]|nr:hypothetical protein [Leptospiraceae bacterium]
MNLFEHFYLNFYGLSLLGGMISWTFAVIFIFLLKQKSKPTKFLAWNIFAGSITYYAYMVSQSFYEPYMTVRILALIPILFFYPLQSYFLLNFPTEVSSRFQKITVSINFSSAILVSIVIIISSLKAKVVYKFDGHFFDFDMPVAIKIYGFAVLYFVFYTLAITIWRFIKAPAQDKYYAGFIILGVFIEGVPSAVLNVLNRLGLVSRQFFFTFYVLFVMLGIFIIL